MFAQFNNSAAGSIPTTESRALVPVPSTSAVSRVTLAAFLRPAGRLRPILSSFSLRERPPFFDLALQRWKKRRKTTCCSVIDKD